MVFEAYTTPEPRPGEGGSDLLDIPDGTLPYINTGAIIMPSIHQEKVARFHAAISGHNHGHHGGHDMYLFHRDWHQQNADPKPPERPDRNWGTDISFGSAFLQMHHEMVRATTTEPRSYMHHDSITTWYQREGNALPGSWHPLQPIPADLGYEPDPSVYPQEIRDVLEVRARQQGRTVEQVLTRKTDHPKLELPRYFTIEGIGPDEPGEPITGARKLADFLNINQLGSCLIYPHNEWHRAIGGAMGSTWTAIADPIFYFGVHWHVDNVFDEYKRLQVERKERLRKAGKATAVPMILSADIDVPDAFTPEQREWAREQVVLSNSLHSL